MGAGRSARAYREGTLNGKEKPLPLSGEEKLETAAVSRAYSRSGCSVPLDAPLSARGLCVYEYRVSKGR